jgi:hypothetical protein
MRMLGMYRVDASKVPGYRGNSSGLPTYDLATTKYVESSIQYGRTFIKFVLSAGLMNLFNILGYTPP